MAQADVCIIGAGAAGGILAQQLAGAGMTVVVIEAGSRYDDPFKAYENNEIKMRKFLWPEPSTGPGLPNIAGGGHNSIGVGGGTLHWAGAAFRLHESDLKFGTLHGRGPDWPLTMAELKPYYEKAERDFGVAGPPDNPWEVGRGPYPLPPHAVNCVGHQMLTGARKLGIKATPGSCAILSRPYEGRAACNYCGFCYQGCMMQAMASTARIHIPRAEKTGRCTVLSNSLAARINLGPDGRVRSVTYFDRQRQEREQEARIVIVSGHTLETPRLLLNSASGSFPNGLANSSGLVGKFYMSHPNKTVFGLFERRLDGYKGFTLNNVMTQDFYETGPRNNFIRGYTLESTGCRTPLSFVNMKGPLWGQALKDYMRNYYTHVAGIWICGEQLPDERNYVTVNKDAKDSYGLPKAHLVHEWRDNDKALIADAERRCGEILLAAGAKEVFTQTPINGVHNLGTVRMGKAPKASVVNASCQSHDVKNLFVCDASVFPTSAGANPTMTIAALAYRTADYIVAAARRREL